MCYKDKQSLIETGFETRLHLSSAGLYLCTGLNEPGA